MNSNSVLGIAATVVLALAACNYTDGECFPRDQLYETSGAGGGVIVPTGVGGYGHVPFEPQNAPPEPDGPVCNIVSGGPCDDKCQGEYDAASLECGKIEDAAQRRACQDTAHANYRACQDKCEQEANKSCFKKYVDCQNGFGPWWCRSESAGSSYCRNCRLQCDRGDPPSGECRECGF
jgi:hypothetical protein